MQPTRTQAIKQFLLASTHPDLASLYTPDMEVQVNVAQDNGERVDGDFKGRQWHGFSDGIQVWKAIRIPYKAKSEPEYVDSEMTYDLASHAEGIGMTGWDWVARASRWVAFDFDHMVGHSDKHARKLTDDELNKLRELVAGVEWVTLRRSTGGRGLHVYVFLEPVHTSNHTEHAALARAVLGKLSATTGYDFSAKVDICGGNMWVWHRKMLGTQGLELLKTGTRLASVPENWQDHVKVVTGRRTKCLPKFIEDQEADRPGIGDQFAELCGQRIRVPLDKDHKRLIDWLQTRYPNCGWWDPDNWMLVTHTALLAEAHEDLTLRGPFKTNATGTARGSDINAYAYPMLAGAWAIRRYTPGVAEHPTWLQDGAGWTRCFYNRLPDFSTACRMHEGLEDPAGGYWFNLIEQATNAAHVMGVDLGLPNSVQGQNRKIKLREHKSGRILVELQHVPDIDQPKDFSGWLNKTGKWHKLYDANTSDSTEPEIVTCDEEIRHLVTPSGDDCGWVISSDGEWHGEPYQHVKTYLASRGYKPGEVQNILGASISRCWKVVNLPFESEYPKDRQWNRRAAQYRYQPSLDQDSLKYETWLSILRHCGQGLDDAVKANPWAQANTILTGADYLKCWIASLLKQPLEPLPYLFFYGPQNSGKSIFHEALALLVTSGVVRADTALISQGNFNGELEHAILCVVEETDLRKNVVAYNRIKDWVTSRQLPVHKKMGQPYTIPNTTHWVQMANTHLACPVFAGDTRITMLYVPDLEPEKLIPKRLLIPMLEREAPDFMSEIMHLELPPSPDRLNIPVILTQDKATAERANQTFLELFIEECCYAVDGSMILWSEFYERFQNWIDPNYIKEWSKVKVGREMPPKFPKGRLPNTGQYWVGNISWEPRKPDQEIRPKLVLRGEKLVPGGG